MLKRQHKPATNFDQIFIRVASPDDIKSWSRGEVTKPETMNYRTQRSEKNGLFDERIFGPEKDFECYCGKYRGIRYRGITCEKCGVEVTRAIVRRERMGHIELSTPVAHVWFLRQVPSRIASILGMPAGDVEKVVYFAGYLVTSVDSRERDRLLKELDSELAAKVKAAQDEKTQEALRERAQTARRDIESLVPGRVLDEVEYHKFSLRFGPLFEAKIGAEAIYELCRSLDLPALIEKLAKDLAEASAATRDKIAKRLSISRAMHRTGVRPEWMFLTKIPVIPPALRPMVALDGGRNATSDVNDLYRRVINRNNRLRKLLDIGAPDVILRNEKRILQEAVDALVDSSIKHGKEAFASASAAARRPLKSLADALKGKRGLFRQNLLGKRVDYSGRSVIVVGPELSIDQTGLPKHMALELFRPFVIGKLIERELAFNIRGAGRLIDDASPEVWEVLEEVIQGKYVLLNRAPTLHRLGIQAFRPVLVEGNAVRVHPLVCSAFNADFDGDQMAVHVPLSEEAQYEAREIMASNRNVLKPGDGEPILAARQDINLGCYWMTKAIEGEKGTGKVFPGPNSAVTAFDYGAISARALIKVRGKKGGKFDAWEDSLLETTVGRILFNEALPEDYPYVNDTVDKSKMTAIVDEMIGRYGIDSVAPLLDRIKTFGFEATTKAGVTFGIDDVQVPKGKTAIVEKAAGRAAEVANQHAEGLLSDEEKLRKVVEIWHGAKGEVEKLVPQALDQNGPVMDMWKSGARGSLSQLTQMCGMKGLIANSRGETIEHPVVSSSKEGLSPIEYFTTTHGSRKGLTDTALNTAKSGYLTRKLFDVAQDVVVSEEDCGTKEHVVITTGSESGIEIPMGKKLRGRVLAEAVKTADGKTLFEANAVLSKADALAVERAGIETALVRSPMTCASRRGVCKMCYGMDLGKDAPVDLGEAVGTVAAQAIGEPGTQLTMRTFHAGGAATTGGDITHGLPRVEELFERRKPKVPAVLAKIDATVGEIREEGKERVIILIPDTSTTKGTTKSTKATEYTFSTLRVPVVKVGQQVKKGDFMTDGSADISELHKLAGRERAQNYIIGEVNRIYELQGAAVSRKHIEVIIKQMFSRVRVIDPGSTGYSMMDIVAAEEWAEANQKAETKGKADRLIMGITEVALSRKSFLSAASFQHTAKILINSAIRGTEDELRGLKENVIIGRLIPAGTGFAGSVKHAAIKKIRDREEARYQQIVADREASMAAAAAARAETEGGGLSMGNFSAGF
jgi:DNA-directed RNA polymerase subunit beta'